MTPIEELNLLQKLIRKYNLPCSPIMEYAINEQKEKYKEPYFIETIENDNIPDVTSEDFNELIVVDSASKSSVVEEVNNNVYIPSYIDIAQNDLERKRMEAVLHAINYFDSPATPRDIARRISRSAWGREVIHEESVDTILKKIPEIEYIKWGKYILKSKKHD